MNVGTDIERYRLETLFSKEPETIQWIQELMHPGDVFYDIGANIGVYSLYAALFHKGVRVCAFEPAYHNFGKLCENIRANHCQNAVIPYCLGLAEKTHAGILNLTDTRAGSAGHRVDKTTYRSGVGAAGIKSGETFEPVLKQGIIAVTVDDLVHIYHLPSPHHLKIDIDGGEEEVLKGGAATLLETVRKVLIEIDDQDGSVEAVVRSFLWIHADSTPITLSITKKTIRASGTQKKETRTSKTVSLRDSAVSSRTPSAYPFPKQNLREEKINLIIDVHGFASRNGVVPYLLPH